MLQHFLSSSHEQALDPTPHPNRPSRRQYTRALDRRGLQTHIHTLADDIMSLTQNRKSEQHLQTCDTYTQDNEHNDDPGDARHLLVADRIRQDFAEVEENLAALVEDLDAGFDFEVFADGGVEWVERGFRVPEEVGGVEHVGR
jgi:hypothetical protein